MKTALVVLLLAPRAMGASFTFEGIITEVIKTCRPEYCSDLEDLQLPSEGSDITGLFTPTEPGDATFGNVEYRFAPWSGRDGLFEPESLADGRLLYQGFGQAALYRDDGERVTGANVELIVSPNGDVGDFILDVDLTGTASEGFGIRAGIELTPVPEPSTWSMAMVAAGILGVRLARSRRASA